MQHLTENIIRLVGHVGADPMIRYLDPHICSARISLATDAEGAVNERGDMVRGMVTDWHTILCYRELAEEVDKTVGTGDLISVEGRLTYIQVKGRTPKQKAVVLARTIEIIQKKEAVMPVGDSFAEEVHNPYGEYLETLSNNPDELPF